MPGKYPSPNQVEDRYETLTGMWSYWALPNGAKTSMNHTRTEWWSRIDRQWFRQQKPYIMTQPYSSWRYDAQPVGLTAISWDHDYFGITHKEYMGALSFSGNVENWLWWRSYDAQSQSSALIARVQNCVLKKAAGTTFNSALFAAEGHKTLDLLRSNCFKILESFRIIRNGRWARQDPRKTAKQALEALGVVRPKGSSEGVKRSAQWLEYRYGVETLMMDVRDAAEYAASKASDQPEQMSWSCQASLDLPQVVYIPPRDWGYFGMGLDLDGSPKVRVATEVNRVKAKAWIRAEVETAGYRSMQQLGFANPVGLAWELIPLSFVVDWALNIGSYLDLQTALWGLKVLDSGYSFEYEGTARVYALPPDLPVWKRISNWKQTGTTHRDYSVSRYQRWWWGNPQPTYTLGTGLNAKRAADALALTILAFKR